MRPPREVVDRRMRLAEIEALAAHLGIKPGQRAGAPFPAVATIHDDVGIGAEKRQALRLGQQELGAA